MRSTIAFFSFFLSPFLFTHSPHCLYPHSLSESLFLSSLFLLPHLLLLLPPNSSSPPHRLQPFLISLATTHSSFASFRSPPLPPPPLPQSPRSPSPSLPVLAFPHFLFNAPRRLSALWRQLFLHRVVCRSYLCSTRRSRRLRGGGGAS